MSTDDPNRKKATGHKVLPVHTGQRTESRAQGWEGDQCPQVLLASRCFVPACAFLKFELLLPEGGCELLVVVGAASHPSPF